MAADLPAIVAHKRRADLRLGEEEDGVPAGGNGLLEAGFGWRQAETETAKCRSACWAANGAQKHALPVAGCAARDPLPHCAVAICVDLLEPPPGTAKKVLEAHRILVTARSLRSVDSSATRTTGTEQGAGDAAAGAGAAQDLDKVKCLLLRALVAALPVLDQPSGGVGGGFTVNGRSDRSFISCAVGVCANFFVLWLPDGTTCNRPCGARCCLPRPCREHILLVWPLLLPQVGRSRIPPLCLLPRLCAF